MIEVIGADQTFEIARPIRPAKIKVNPDGLVPGSFAHEPMLEPGLKTRRRRSRAA